MIEIKKYTDLLAPGKIKLNECIDNEFGHIPIVKETEWESPDWTIVYYLNGELATFYNIIEREVFIDGAKFKVGGVNNVITLPEFRGRGLSTMLLKETEDFMFKELNSELGLLLCADELIPFYNRLNWYEVNCPVYFDQSGGRNLWKANTMLRTDKRLNPKEIDLNGLPW